MNCIEVTTTIGCVNHCRYCPQDRLLDAYRGNKILHLDAFKRYMKRVPQQVKVHFSGFSEPFFNFETTSMIEHCIEEGRNVGLFTTTRGMLDVDIKILSRYNIEPFVVHIPEQFKGFIANYIKARFELMEDSGIDFKIAKVGESQTDDVKEIYELYSDRLIFQPIISRGGSIEGRDVADGKCVEGTIDCRDKRYHQPVLLPNGDLAICCMDYGLEHIIGNLGKNTLAEIYDGEVYRDFISKLVDSDCSFMCRRCFRGEGI